MRPGYSICGGPEGLVTYYQPEFLCAGSWRRRAVAASVLGCAFVAYSGPAGRANASRYLVIRPAADAGERGVSGVGWSALLRAGSQSCAAGWRSRSGVAVRFAPD